MENERELLELAAKACGYKLDLTIRPDVLPFFHSERRALALESGEWFAPGVDDGDCARMEAYLKLNIEWCGTFVLVTDSEGSARCSEHFISHQDDQTARRMASLRVAAEIGRAMQSDKR